MLQVDSAAEAAAKVAAAAKRAKMLADLDEQVSTVSAVMTSVCVCNLARLGCSTSVS